MKNNIIAIDVSKEYQYYVDKLIERTKREIYEWFNHPTLEEKVNIYIYKDIPSLIEGLKRRGLGPYPDYMVACMVDEDKENGIKRSINFYEPSKTPEENEYTKKEYNNVILHELIHYITDILYGKLPEWLTEGIAKYLDGSYKTDLTELMHQYIATYEIPDISTMKGERFVVKDNEKTIYNGYDLSYIIVRYIIEVYGKETLFSLMKNKKQLKQIEQQLLPESIEYFNSQYPKENTIKK